METIQAFENVISFFSDPEVFVKIVLILLVLLFLLFTIIFARQTSHLLNLVNQVSFSPIFKSIAYGMIVLTLLLLVAVIFV